MARFSLTNVILRVLTDNNTGDSINISGEHALAFDTEYLALMHDYRDNEDIVLGILWDHYKVHDRPDFNHTPD